MQKFIHFSLIVALLMGSMGFRVNTMRCAGDEKSGAVSLSMTPDCCCSKAAKKQKAPCSETACVIQLNVASQSTFTSSSQQEVASAAVPVQYPSFTQRIRPLLLETLPYVTLPPPPTGRDIGILHQTFLL
ncbi:hypothetical protein [Rufibacter sediminis]|nr:hypothetical protein [Rufibacter sediminis]